MFGMGRNEAVHFRAAAILAVIAAADGGIEIPAIQRELYLRGQGYSPTTLYRDIHRLCQQRRLVRRLHEIDGRPIIRYCIGPGETAAAPRRRRQR